MEKITARQKKVLDFITDHLDSYGYPPTLREIGGHLGVSGTLGVIKHLDARERKGDHDRRPWRGGIHPYRRHGPGRGAAACHRGDRRLLCRRSVTGARG